jgi:uncharacterized coiled-coil protein SlyX
MIFGRSKRIKELEDQVAWLRRELEEARREADEWRESAEKWRKRFSSLISKLEELAESLRIPLDFDNPLKFVDELKGFIEGLRGRLEECEARIAQLTTQPPSPSLSASTLRFADADPVEEFLKLDEKTGFMAREVFKLKALGYDDLQTARIVGARLRFQGYSGEVSVKDVKGVVRELVYEDFLHPAYLKDSRGREVLIHFPTYYGLEVFERLELVEGLGPEPWNLLQYDYLKIRMEKRRRKFLDHEEMVQKAKELFSIMGCEVLEGKDVEGLRSSVEWLKRVQPDLLISLRGNSANSELVPVEVETLSNSLDDFEKKLRNYKECCEELDKPKPSKPIPLFIVVDELAKRMLISRIAYCVDSMSEGGRESFKFSIASLEELRKLVRLNELERALKRVREVFEVEVEH